jgi:Transposase DDE domain
MQAQDPTEFDVQGVAKMIMGALSEDVVKDLARRSGWQQREREVTALGMLVACLSALGASQCKWLADILRAFNAFTGKKVQYKPFHTQLKKREFPEFLRLVLEQVLAKLTMPVLKSLPEGKLSIFQDIVLHDGTSFAVKNSLAEAWPGRFTKSSPAAVELHVSMSALKDNPLRIVLAPDKDSERAFTPEPESLKGCLVIEDRGFQDQRYFRAIQQAEGWYVVRGTKNIRPTIDTAHDFNGRRVHGLEGKRLSWEILPAECLDLDITWKIGTHVYKGRLVVIYRQGKRNEKTFVYLHTNLERSSFSIQEVGTLYRLRWQVELLFKEWKSHTNLHSFDTSKEAIVEALIWASLLTATLKRFLTHAAERIYGVELSTQRAAKCGKNFLDDLLKQLLRGAQFVARVLVQVFEYLAENARRANPSRDRKTGRLSAGLRPIISES